MSRHPTTKWAQRSDKVFITIELPDAKDLKLSLQPEGQFSFYATTGSDKIPYELDFELYDKVNVEESKAAVGLRNICYLVKKAERKWWSRLLKQEGKPPVYLKVDWDKWVDEDEDDGVGDMEGGDMDFSKLGMDDGDVVSDDDADQVEDDNERGKAQVGDAAKEKAKGEEASGAASSDDSEAKA
ncbi:Uncharacterized protein M6B38_111380 [Iris pallida]|uniref:Co-chaperone protein p23 n=1 Tax=Iris pallida TaxID=29817 RepID=A0AAX6DN04_IRIPA|nr:Uncharacterized protein M6B38_111380 [Iris pallida]